MRFSREVLLLGIVQLGSAAALLVHGYLFGDAFRVLAGWSAAGIGFLLLLVGFLWHGESSGRPLGVTLLALSYFLGGIILLLFGGFFFTWLFLVALVFLATGWWLLEGNDLGRVIAFIILIPEGILLTFAGVSSLNIINVGGVLGSLYLLWYLNRPHVAAYFGAEPLRFLSLLKKGWIVPLAIVFLIGVGLMASYANPPTRTVLDDTWQLSCLPDCSGGGKSIDAVFGAGDIVQYSFSVDTSSQGPVRLSFIESTPTYSVTSTAAGLNGSGEFKVSSTGVWSIFFGGVGTSTHVSAQINVRVVMVSLRANLVQLLVLNGYIGAVFTYQIFFGKTSMQSPLHVPSPNNAVTQ